MHETVSMGFSGVEMQLLSRMSATTGSLRRMQADGRAVALSIPSEGEGGCAPVALAMMLGLEYVPMSLAASQLEETSSTPAIRAILGEACRGEGLHLYVPRTAAMFEEMMEAAGTRGALVFTRMGCDDSHLVSIFPYVRWGTAETAEQVRTSYVVVDTNSDNGSLKQVVERETLVDWFARAELVEFESFFHRLVLVVSEKTDWVGMDEWEC